MGDKISAFFKGKLHIGKRDIVHIPFPASLDDGRFSGISSYMEKRYIGNGFCLFRPDPPGSRGNIKGADTVQPEIFKHDIFYSHSFTCNGILGNKADGSSGIMDDDIGNIASSYETVSHPDTECIAAGGKHAVRNGDIFAAFVFTKRSGIAPQGDAVISRMDDAVTYGDETAAVDIHPVSVVGAEVIGIAQSPYGDIFASVEKKGPVGRMDLSVQKANYASKLYLKLGFEIFSETEEEYIMVYSF